MKKTIVSFVREMLNDQRGQILPWIAVVLVGMLGMAGVSIDAGRAYIVRSQLQNVANAAALAAAGNVYSTNSTDNATTVATQYSSGSGDMNAGSGAGTITPTVTSVCLNVLMPNGTTCNSSSPANAVKVTESASVPTYLMKLFGFSNLNVSATATASMQGVAQPWNVAIIVDGTGSMSTVDSNCGGLTRFQCALSGVQAFLTSTNPCPGGMSSCTPSTANLRVALFAFPNISTTTGFSDTNTCNGPFVNAVYTLPKASATSYSPIQYTKGATGGTQYTATYQMTDWDTGYYQPSNSTTHGLNPNDNLVKTIGYGYNSSTGTVGHQGCLPNVGNQGTYYGGVMYAAQAALLSAQSTYGGKNALILLSDGEAQTDSTHFPVKISNTTSGVAVTSAGTTTYSASATNLTSTAGAWGTYPDYNNECQQAILAAQAAAAAGTRVYAVAYGSSSTGCSTDTDTRNASNLNQSTLNVNWGAIANLKPCETMENIANPEAGSTVSWQKYFFSDNQQSGATADRNCVNTTQTATTLSDIFLEISSNFTTPRLLPNNAQ